MKKYRIKNKIIRLDIICKKNKIKSKNKNKNKKSKKSIQNKNCFCLTICPKMCDNNRFDNLVLPLVHGWSIWYFSYLHFFTSMYALINQYYILSLFGFGSMGSSLNYWKYPLHDSWRRYFDIIFIQLSFYVHTYYAFQSSNLYGYIFFSCSGIISYGTSNYYIRKNLFLATYFHILVHIFASIANAILYSGKIN